MSDTTSDHAVLLRALDFAAAEFDSAIYEEAASAIRALEAKVQEKTADAESHLRHERMWRKRAQEAFAEIERLQKVLVDEHVADEQRVDELTADHDRLAAENAELRADAKRYRYIQRFLKNPVRLDAAIDVARGAGGDQS